MSNKKFGAVLKKLRNERGLAQHELATILNIHKSTMSKYEAGRIPDAGTLNTIAEYFNVKVDYLLGNEEEPEVLQAIKRVNSDISQKQGDNKAAQLIKLLIESGMIDKNGEADEEVWALIKSAIRKQAQEANNLNRKDAIFKK